MPVRPNRRNVVAYVPWVLVAILSYRIFISSQDFSSYDLLDESTGRADSMLSSVSSSSLFPFSSSRSEGLPVRQHPQQDHSSIPPPPVLPPWADRILMPELEKKKGRTNDGRCMIGEIAWENCGLNDRFCATYGEGAVGASQIHIGQTRRLRRVMRKAARGEPVTLAVIGGSVSTGQGIYEKPHRNYKYQLVDWWQYAFPNSHLTFIDGSVHGQGSPFFSACFGAVIPEDVDIVFIDSAINDIYKEKDAINAESVMRGIMQLPKQPAIVLLQTFGLSFDKIATGGSLHLDIAAYYDHPVLSARQVILPYVFKDPDSVSTYFGLSPDGSVDLRHISHVGHTILAELAVQFLSSIYCKVQRDQFLHGARPEPPLLDPPEDLPRHPLMEPYDPARTFPVYAPVCNSTESTLRPLTPSAPTKWTPEVLKGKRTLAGHNPGEEIRFKVDLATKGTLQINFLRSSFYDLGIAKCYIDFFGPESAVTLDGYWTLNYSVGELIILKENIPAGEHEIICTVQEETHSPKGGKKVLIVSIQSF